MNGGLIVLEGIDGSGKSTQYDLTCKKLKEDGIAFTNIVFPRYDRESSALIRLYLGGAFGSRPDDVNAYTASAFYAVDRFASYRDDWGKLYENNAFIFADRYTTSNFVHQGSKLPEDELEDFFSWLSDLEYKKMGLPAPDLVIYQDVTLEIAENRRHLREAEKGTHADIHEQDEGYLAKCLCAADRACDYFGWKRIACLDEKGNVRGIEEKNEEIYQIIKNYLNG